MNKRIKKKLTKRYCAWLNYESGFSGQGITLLDIKPKFPKPKRLSIALRKELDKRMEEWRILKQQAMRQACLDVLGEDPDDWQ